MGRGAPGPRGTQAHTQAHTHHRLTQRGSWSLPEAPSSLPCGQAQRSKLANVSKSPSLVHCCPLSSQGGLQPHFGREECWGKLRVPAQGRRLKDPG